MASELQAAPPARRARRRKTASANSNINRHQHRDRHRPRGRVHRADRPAATAGAGMVLASGPFDEVKIESLMREHGARSSNTRTSGLSWRRRSTPTRTSNGRVPVRLAQAAPELALSFLKPGLVALGSVDLIRRAIDLENGGDNITTNEEVMNLDQVARFRQRLGRRPFRRDADDGQASRRGQSAAPDYLVFRDRTDQRRISGVVRAETPATRPRRTSATSLRASSRSPGCRRDPSRKCRRFMQSLQISGTGKTVALSFSVPGTVLDMVHPAGAQPNRRPIRVRQRPPTSSLLAASSHAPRITIPWT